ncbi:hypothetical protein ACFX1S_040795 [Malus domestica]
MLIEKKLKTFFAACEGPPTADKLVIDLTSSKWKKDEAAKFEHVRHAMPKMASTIVDKIAQRVSSIVPLVLKFIPIRLLGAEFGLPLEMLTTMKSDKVDSTAKVAPRPIPFAAETGSPTEKDKTACMGSCEKSTKPVSRKSVEICALLKPDLLEDMDTYARLIDGIRVVVCPSSFVKHTTQYRMTTLVAMM